MTQYELINQASLFSAVVATFAVEGINSGGGSNVSPAGSRRGRASNPLIFASLMVSLATASAGTLVKQWVQQYLEEDFDSAARHHVCMRQYRYDGLQKWRVPLFVGLLPAMLRVSFILFATGLAIRLYDVDHTAAISFATLGGIWVLLSLLAAVFPLLSDNCPYRSPESLLVLNIGLFISRFFRRSLYRFLPRFPHFRRFSYQFPRSLSLRFLHHVLHFFLYLIFHLLFRLFLYRLLWHSFCRVVHPVWEGASWDSWRKRDHGVVIPQPGPDGVVHKKQIAGALQQALAEIRVTQHSLHILQTETESSTIPDPEARHPSIQAALGVLSEVGSTLDEASIGPLLAPKLHAARMRFSALMKCLDGTGLRNQLERCCGGQRYLVIKQMSRLVRAIDRARSIVQASNKTTELGMQALVTVFFEFAPSNPSLSNAVGICLQSFHPADVLQIIHRIGFKRMHDRTFQAHEYVEPQDWRGLWRLWETPNDAAKALGELTKSESKMILEIIADAVSKAKIIAVGKDALKDTVLIADIAEPAALVTATLLRGNGLHVDSDLRKSIMTTALKLLADYPVPESGDTTIAAFLAALRLCSSTPPNDENILEKLELEFPLSKGW